MHCLVLVTPRLLLSDSNLDRLEAAGFRGINLQAEGPECAVRLRMHGVSAIWMLLYSWMPVALIPSLKARHSQGPGTCLSTQDCGLSLKNDFKG